MSDKFKDRRGTGRPLPVEIQTEIESVLESLEQRGWCISEWRFSDSCFGNWLVDFARDGEIRRMVKDRSQYWTFEPAKPDAGPVFDSLHAFVEAVRDRGL
ncbi:MAG: hypothetical protein IT452_01610 [Planctomycetia bacterium]|nr:hypothetical protein [Planctomycetia bacterium]